MKTRRAVLASLGFVGVTGAVTWINKNSAFRWLFLMNENSISNSAYAPLPDDGSCVVPTSQVEGPFYFKSPLRSDIREDRKGIQLNLRLAITQGSGCSPIEGALVEIWQCDASGKYSGYPEDSSRDFWKSLNFTGIKGMIGEIHIPPINGKTFLRGSQITDSNGVVEFVTVFPGWYEPRAPHIHVKAIIDGNRQFDLQYYFETDLADEIYSYHQDYSDFGRCPYNVTNDLSLRGKGEAIGVLLKPEWKENDQLEVEAKINVKS
ncbi:MAG TPA: hypothetical protein VLA64_12995 [Azonexus sp.]|nr:hypothetical protein [Azonexus sp.]